MAVENLSGRANPGAGPVKVIEDIRVIDLGSYIAAPYAAMLLAELGADVVKVERPGSADPSRGYVVDGKAPVFSAVNRNKRAVALDYIQPEGLAVLRRMVERADVVIVNVRPGVERKLGVDAESLQAINSRLVYCSITGFGASGPYAHRPAYDNVGQALSGVLSRFHQGRDARVYGPAMTDNITGMQACIGILGALHERARTGMGRRVEVNLMEAMVGFAVEPLIDTLFTGKEQPFYHRGGVSQAYVVTCRDGLRIGLHLSAPDKFWHALARALDRPDLSKRYPTSTLRLAHYSEIAATLAEIFATRDRDAWLPLLEAHDVPFGPERKLDEIADDPQIVHLGTFAKVDANAHGAGLIPNRPQRYDGDNRSVFRPAPRTGEHTDEVLREFGLDSQALAALREKRIVG